MTDRRQVKRLIKVWVGIIAILIVTGYGAFQAKNIVLGPRINVSSPIDGSLATSSLIEITGTARNISYLTLNNNKIFTDEKGIFKESILLSYGYNILTLQAQDRFGRTIIKTIQLTYK